MNVADDGMAPFGDMPREVLSDDKIPNTLIPVLKFIVKDYLAEIVSTGELFNQRIRNDPNLKTGDPIFPAGKVPMGQSMKQSFGNHTIDYHDLTLELSARSYSMYMFQRPLDYYQSLTGTEKESVDSLLRNIGAYDAMQFKALHRIIRVDGQEVFE